MYRRLSQPVFKLLFEIQHFLSVVKWVAVSNAERQLLYGDAAIDELVRLLLPYQLPAQYFFAPQRVDEDFRFTSRPGISALF